MAINTTPEPPTVPYQEPVPPGPEPEPPEPKIEPPDPRRNQPIDDPGKGPPQYGKLSWSASFNSIDMCDRSGSWSNLSSKPHRTL